jgi:superfamily II helicase
LIAAKARFRYAKKLQRIAGYRVPDFAFNGAFMDILVSSLDYDSLDRTMRSQIIQFYKDFLECKCKESPQCGCPERKFALKILELRRLGLDHRQISEILVDDYGVEIYPTDILSFLEDSVHTLEAIRDVARIEGKEKLLQETIDAIREIEGK